MLKLFMKKGQGKKDNKGFSLVELIVVIAIMGILAVVMTPKLTHYLNKAKLATDKEIVNTFYTGVQMALIDEELWNSVPATYKTGTGVNILSTLYSVSTHTYTAYTNDPAVPDEPYDSLSEFEKEVMKIVGKSFTFKSTEMTGSTNPTIYVFITDQGDFTVKCTGSNGYTYDLPQ